MPKPASVVIIPDVLIFLILLLPKSAMNISPTVFAAIDLGFFNRADELALPSPVVPKVPEVPAIYDNTDQLLKKQ